jgi:hypothetical protein
VVLEVVTVADLALCEKEGVGDDDSGTLKEIELEDVERGTENDKELLGLGAVPLPELIGELTGDWAVFADWEGGTEETRAVGELEVALSD